MNSMPSQAQGAFQGGAASQPQLMMFDPSKYQSIQTPTMFNPPAFQQPAQQPVPPDQNQQFQQQPQQPPQQNQQVADQNQPFQQHQQQQNQQAVDQNQQFQNQAVDHNQQYQQQTVDQSQPTSFQGQNLDPNQQHYSGKTYLLSCSKSESQYLFVPFLSLVVCSF